MLSANFSTPLWVRAEIASMKIRKGHRYLELVEKESESDRIKSKAFASLWAGNYALIKRSIKEDIDLILKEGQEVLVLLKVSFHVKYGLSLQIQDIDPTFTIGKYFSKKQQLFNQIRKEELDKIQKTLKMPPVLQNIAVISSPKAAGYMDFCRQIEQSRPYMQIHWDLFDSNMQGAKVEVDILHALDRIARNPENYDAVVIVRGGGAKLDLMDFDNYKLASKIAQFPLPVITGIGHDMDFSALDLVAAVAVKTPTAAAQYIIDKNLDFISRIEVARIKIKEEATRQINRHKQRLNLFRSEISSSAKVPLLKGRFAVEQIASSLGGLSENYLRRQKEAIAQIKRELDISNPKRVMERGYSIVSLKGKVIKSSEALNKEDQLELTLYRGKASVEVIDKTDPEE